MLVFTMTEKVLAGLLVAAIAIGGGYGVYAHNKIDKTAVAQTVAVEKQKVVAAEASVQYASAVAATVPVTKAAEAKVQGAVNANPVLRDTPVPDAVFDGLRDAQRGYPAE